MKICDLYNTESNPKFGAKLIKIFLFYIVFECHYEESSREKEFSPYLNINILLNNDLNQKKIC